MQACLYHSLAEGKVQCDLCAHRCVIKPGRRGICSVRENQGGELKTLIYGRLIAAHVDPIEKKPFFHLLPGSRSYSIAAVGCNFSCRFCQNADIAQMPHDRDGLIMGDPTEPDEVVAAALRAQCVSIAYTYTEPTVNIEFVLATATIAKARGLKNVLVTNGYLTPEALEIAAPLIDGANVDLKGYSDAFYHSYCGAHLEPVKATLRQMQALNILIEVTTLIIPGLNDSPEELTALAGFLYKALGPQTPWHISRFHPSYRLTDREVTPAPTLRQAREIGIKAGLHHIYLGNVPGENGENTLCHGCGAVLIERRGFTVRLNRIQNDRCPHCQTPLYGIGMSPVS